MNWIAFGVGYVSVGLLIWACFMKPSTEYRKKIDGYILQDGGVSFRIVLTVILMILIAPVSTLLFTISRPFAMRKHRKEMDKRMKYHLIYRKMMGYGGQIKGICELCHKPYAHVHHIEPKGMGGRKNADEPDNLIGLCVDCHGKCHGVEAKEMRVRCLGAIAKRKKYFKKKGLNQV